MADDQEKTEEPTSKKIEDARKDGNVPKSQDASSFVTLVVGIFTFLAIFPFMQEHMVKLYHYYQSFMGVEFTKNMILEISIITFREIILMVIPLAVTVAIAGLLAGFLQFGFIFTSKPLIPDLTKLDPIKGLKNLLSVKKFVETIKVILKVAMVFMVAYYYLFDFAKEMPSVVYLPIFEQLSWLREKALLLGSSMLLLFFILALFDLFFVRYNYFKDLKMSKQEIKDEYKQMEGDPQIKARIRKIQMEMTKKRMMQEIPQADVVITNPTHYAVALRYDKEKDNAPIILAKGMNHLALKIKEIARLNEIQIVENPPLARELYKKCEVNDTIPDSLYKAVAEVLAFVYKTGRKK